VRGLYAIIDTASLLALEISPLEFARRVLEARPAALQLRAKQLRARETLALLGDLRPLASKAGTPLFANDRPDLALLAGCDGVHVGQDDLPVGMVRRFARGLRVGVSTHDLDQLEAALAEAPDYVAFGPLFATSSKADPDPVVGLDGLKRARKLCTDRPLVAIGGIDLERAPEVARYADCGAVISALLPPEGDLDKVADQAHALHLALGGT
jgi:thiamine-phosphate pyrophosphorylase